MSEALGVGRKIRWNKASRRWEMHDGEKCQQNELGALAGILYEKGVLTKADIEAAFGFVEVVE